MLDKMSKEKVSLEYTIDEKSLLFTKIRTPYINSVEKEQKTAIVKFLQELTQFKKEVKEMAQSKRSNRTSSRLKPEAKQTKSSNRCLSKGKIEDKQPILGPPLNFNLKLSKLPTKSIIDNSECVLKNALNKENTKEEALISNAEYSEDNKILKETNNTQAEINKSALIVPKETTEETKNSTNIQEHKVEEHKTEVQETEIYKDGKHEGDKYNVEESKDEQKEVEDIRIEEQKYEELKNETHKEEPIENQHKDEEPTNINADMINKQDEQQNSGLIKEEVKVYEEEMPEYKNRKCGDCVDSVYEEAILECRHSVCEDCVIQYICHYFTYSRYYNYSLFCSTCEQMKTICNFIINQRRNKADMWV
jgi:hypothetical protein